MRKHMKLLLTSGMAMVGLAAGVTPAHAHAEAATVWVYTKAGFIGRFDLITTSKRLCEQFTFSFDIDARIRSAQNSAFAADTIYFYDNFNCDNPIAILAPGESDNGLGTSLGVNGARWFCTTNVEFPESACPS